MAAGGLAAALSTAAGLLLVISSAVSHDLIKNTLAKNVSERQELRYARISAAVAIFIRALWYLSSRIRCGGGCLRIWPAAASFFPAIVLGIFSTRVSKEGAIAGMLTGIGFTASYIVYFKFIDPANNVADAWWFGISPEGIGTLGMLLNFAVTLSVSRFTQAPPDDVQSMVLMIREPSRGD